MDRRVFLGGLATGLALIRRAAAQPQGKVARIGFLYFGSRQSALDSGRYQMFVQGMRELDYIEGTSLSWRHASRTVNLRTCRPSAPTWFA